ncbi:MAG: hypothetical protein AAF915_12800 [Cyanobacteria bacterium P01_D01_bin.50]
MSDQNKKAVSDIITLTGAFVKPETAQATEIPSNSSIETTPKLSTTQQLLDASNKIKATKKVFDFVKGDTKKAINKARNIRNDALKKAYQAEEILKGAKEDWETKVIIAAKKFKEVESKPEKKYLIKQTEQAIIDVEKAKENFENKRYEANQKKINFQQSQEKLEVIIRIQKSRIKAAKMACKRAQMEIPFDCGNSKQKDIIKDSSRIKKIASQNTKSLCGVERV